MLFGVSSVIAMLAIGEGASEEAQEQIRQLGSQNVIFRSVKPPDDAVSNQSTWSNNYGLTWKDFEAVRDTFPWVTRAVPVRALMQEVRVGSNLINPRVLATTSEYLEVTGRLVYEGRFLGVEAQRRTANVCVLGYEVARCLNSKSIFFERTNEEFELRRGFEIEQNKNILFIEDVITTGKSSKECLKKLFNMNINILGIACIVDRSHENIFDDHKIISLLKLDIPTYDSDNLPEDLINIEPVKPGSRKS